MKINESKHLKARSVPRVSKGNSFTTRDFKVFSVSRHFLYSKNFTVLPVLDTFRIQRILVFSV